MKRNRVYFFLVAVMVFSACDSIPDHPPMDTEWISMTETGLEEVRYMLHIPSNNMILAGGFPLSNAHALSLYDPSENKWTLITDKTPDNQQVSWIASRSNAIAVSFFSGSENDGAIKVSHDQGKTFTDRIPIPENTDPRCFVIQDDALDSILLGTVNDGLFITRDGGRTWEKPQTPPADDGIQSLAVNYANSDHILAGARTGLWKSMDGGIHWDSITSRLLSERYFVVEVSAHPDKPDIFSCILRDPLGAAHVYLTKDGGSSWVSIRDGFYDDSQPRTITWHPAEPDVMFAGTVMDGVYRSDNLGEKWYPRNRGLPLDAGVVIVHRLLIVNEASPVIYAGLNIKGQILKLDIH